MKIVMCRDVYNQNWVLRQILFFLQDIFQGSMFFQFVSYFDGPLIIVFLIHLQPS